MAILLRKLTLKSKLGFGHFKELTIQEIITRNKIRELLNIYYTCAQIDYDDDVKFELCIPPIRQIGKPGKIDRADAYPDIEASIQEFAAGHMGFSEKRIDNPAPLLAKVKSRAQFVRTSKENSKMLNMNRNRKNKS